MSIYDRIVFMGGITVIASAKKFFINGDRANRAFDSLADAEQTLGLRPILLQDSSGALADALLNLRTGALLGITISDTANYSTGRSSMHVRNIVYVLGAVVHHCTALAGLYARAATRMGSERERLGFSNVPHSLQSGVEEFYYEFEALVTRARRLYDVPSGLIRLVWGTQKDGSKDSLKKVLSESSSMPPGLRARIERSFAQYGERSRQYRTSVEHYAPLEFGQGTVDFLQHAVGSSYVRARVPDNPSANSRQKFVFSGQHDALAYGAELATELAELMSEVVIAAAEALAGMDGRES